MRPMSLVLLAAALCAPLVAQQTGDANRNFVVNGNGSFGTSPVATNVFGDLQLDYTTAAPGAPIILASANQSTIDWIPALIASSVDVGPAGLTFLLDGFATTNPFSPFLRTDANGGFRLTVSIPSAFQGTSTFLAMAHADATSPDGLYVSQTHAVSFQASFCNPAATNLNLFDDSSSVQLLGFPFTFYGTAFTEVEVWSNGSIVFGTGGFGGFNFDPNSFISTSNPEVAGFARDLNPSQGGTVSYYTNNAGFAQACWEAVPSYFNSGSNTFRVDLDASGLITMTYQNCDGTAALVGLSAGNNLYAGQSVDLTVPGGNAFAAPETIYEVFPGVSDLSNTTITWLLDSSGTPILQF